MQQEDFSPEESLRVIRSTIERAKKNLSEDAFLMILWGWLILVAALGQYVLKVLVQFPQHYLVWNLMWVGAIISAVYAFRSERKAKVKTQLSETMKYIGIGTGTTFTVISFIVGAYEMWQYAFPFYFALYGWLSFVIGSIINYVPLRAAGIGCWIIAVIAVFVPFDIDLLLMGLAAIVAYLVPGYLLEKRRKSNQS